MARITRTAAATLAQDRPSILSTSTIRPVALAAALLLTGAASAQTAPAPAAAPASAPALERVEIIPTTPGGSGGLKKWQIAAPVQSASGAELARSGALDVSEFLNRSFGSVHVNEMQGNALQMDVNYRGYTASPLLGTPQGLSVYLDGVRMNQPFGDVVSWDLIPSEALASISLMPGSNPLYGLNTLGGALALTTKDGLSHPGSAVQLKLGSHARRTLSLEHGGSDADNQLDWYAAARLHKDHGWRDDSPSKAQQFFGKLGWQDGGTRLSLSIGHAESDLNGNGLQEMRLLDRDYASVYTKPDQTRNVSDLINIALRHALSDSTTLSGNLYYRRIGSSTFNGDINEGSLDQSVYTLSTADKAALTAAGISYPSTALNAANTPFPYLRCIAQALQNDEPGEKCNGLLNRTQSSQENVGLSMQLASSGELGGRRHQSVIGAGIDTNRTHFKQSTQLGYLNPDRSITGVNSWADGVNGGDVDGEPLDNRVDLSSRSHTWSVFAADTISLDPNLHLTLSGRWNRTTVRNRDGIVTGGGADSLDGDHRFSRFNPAVGLSWSPSRDLNVYGGYSESSRAPTAIELGCANPDNPCKLPNSMAGDPPLKQVVTKTIELGVRGQLDSTTQWRLGAFRADNHDDILFVADEQAGFGYFRNFGQTRRQGLEAGVTTRQGPWSLAVNWTLIDATYQSEETVNGTGNSSSGAGGLEGTINIEEGNRIPLVPRQMLKVGLGYAVTEQLGLDLDVIGVGGSYARGNENNAHQADGKIYLGPGRSAGYAVVNLGTRFQATPSLTFTAQVANLFDRRYATAAQLGATGFDANGNFQARALGGSSATGYPVQQSTFYAPGAPRSFSVAARYSFD